MTVVGAGDFLSKEVPDSENRCNAAKPFILISASDMQHGGADTGGQCAAAELNKLGGEEEENNREE